MNKWLVDFKAVKEAVSMEMVLSRYGVELRRVNRVNLRGRCPLPSHSSETSKETFGVNTSKKAWACQSQSCVAARGGRVGGNVLDFVALMESCSVREAAEKLASWFSVSSGSGSAATASLPRSAKDNTKLAAKEKQVDGASDNDKNISGNPVNTPLKFTLKGIDPLHSYLAKRGISQETAEHFGVGHFPGKGSMSGRIVFPIHNAKGELVAYAGRALDDAEPRYRLPANFAKTQELFNLHRAIKVSENGGVVVVEGFFDCLKVHQAGFPSVVALMGWSLSDAQFTLLAEYFDKIIVMLDGNDVGQAAARDIASRLASRVLVRIVDLPDGKEPDLLSSQEIGQLLQHLV
jgi:DNA primase